MLESLSSGTPSQGRPVRKNNETVEDSETSAVDAMLHLGNRTYSGGVLGPHSLNQGYSSNSSLSQDDNVSLGNSTHQQGFIQIREAQSENGFCKVSQQQQLRNQQRKEREFIPEFRKDHNYWLKRHKNNEAAKRSREKRRLNDAVMNDKIVELTNEITSVKAQLSLLKRHVGIPQETVVTINLINSITQAKSRNMYVLPPLSNSHIVSGTTDFLPQPTTHQYELTSQTKHQLPPHTNAVEQGHINPSDYIKGLSPATSNNYQPTEYTASTNYEQASLPVPASCSDSTMALPLHPHPGTAVPISTLPHSGHIPELMPLTFPNCSYNSATAEKAVLNNIPASDSGSVSPASLRICTSPPSSESDGDEEKPINYSTRSNRAETSDSENDNPAHFVSAGVPLKLRHKNFAPSICNANISIVPDHQIGNDTICVDGDNAWSSDSVTPDANESTGGAEHRQRNKMSAKKFRDNKKKLTELRMAKFKLVENDNISLKKELGMLTSEVRHLRTLLDKKRQCLARGESFEIK